MAVLKQTSPTASVAAPKPRPSNTVPSARTRSAVARAFKSAPAGAAGDGESISLIGNASDLAENRDAAAVGQEYRSAHPQLFHSRLPHAEASPRLGFNWAFSA